MTKLQSRMLVAMFGLVGFLLILPIAANFLDPSARTAINDMCKDTLKVVIGALVGSVSTFFGGKGK